MKYEWHKRRCETLPCTLRSCHCTCSWCADFKTSGEGTFGVSHPIDAAGNAWNHWFFVGTDRIRYIRYTNQESRVFWSLLLFGIFFVAAALDVWYR
jgi:hypothetical protein